MWKINNWNPIVKPYDHDLLRSLGKGGPYSNWKNQTQVIWESRSIYNDEQGLTSNSISWQRKPCGLEETMIAKTACMENWVVWLGWRPPPSQERRGGENQLTMGSARHTKKFTLDLKTEGKTLRRSWGINTERGRKARSWKAQEDTLKKILILKCYKVKTLLLLPA